MKMQLETNFGLLRIAPEKVARKLAAIRNRENVEALKQIEERPRLVEMLWFLQAMSLQPGGLGKFCEDMVAAMPERIGTPTMLNAHSRHYSLSQKEAIYAEIPEHWRPIVECEKTEFQFYDVQPNEEEIEARRKRNRKALLKELSGLSADYFESRCRKSLFELPAYMVALCIDAKVDFSFGANKRNVGALGPFEKEESAYPWSWCFDPVSAVFEMMDRTAVEAQKQIAMTDIAKRVFQEMDYALQEKVMVRIEGESGFGKTEAIEVWCNMRPGKARIVRVPDGNGMKDFIKAIAEAFGIDCSFGSNLTGLAAKVDYIVQHGELFLILDECAFLIPRSYWPTSSPPRLEWVRAKILDRGLPVVLASTPTKWASEVSRFQKKTNYTLEEFFRRTFLTVRLPSSLNESDMIAVARIHFPQLDDDALGFIANEARLSTNYLQAVEAIGKRARFLSGGKQIRLSLIERAIADVLPGREQTSTSALNFKGQSKPVLQPAKRAVKPDLNDNFKPCSLRGTAPEMAEAELVSADS